MRLRTPLLSIFAAILFAAPLQCLADNATYTYAGGTFSTGVAQGQAITVQNVPMSAPGATASFSCPITAYTAGTYALNWTCAGGSVTIATPDNSVVFTGTFSSGSMNFSGSGGGRGGHVTYWYSFYGAYSGTLTAGGVTQAVNGSLTQYVKTTKQIGAGSAAVTSGSFGWASAYSPLLVGDSANGRIMSADSITGANLASYGSYGIGTGHFENIGGLAQDAAMRIYISDSSLNHIVRIDSIAGKNWVQLGGLGTGLHHFNTPRGLAIDAAGRIWIADSGNNRIVRMDDMSGTNWTSFGTLGTGASQFNSPSSIAFDSLGRIYVADTGNNRVVRFDDLTGANWVSLTGVPSSIYIYQVVSPVGVAVNAAGQIFIALGGTYSYLLSVNDMSGTGGKLSSWSSPLNAISLDHAGTVYVAGRFGPGLAEVEDAAATGYFASGLGGAVIQPTAVYAVSSPSPTPADGMLSAPSLTFASQNVGEPSAAQTLTLTNLGSTALGIASIAAGPDFLVSKTCGASLVGGASCTISVKFDPRTTGPHVESLVVTTTGATAVVRATLTGAGTAPTAIVVPGSLTFDAQTTQTSSAAQVATLTNTGSGPLTIKSITATGDFSQSNNCGLGLSPGNGCTISVVFKPTVAGARMGMLTISDDAVARGATQTVALAGTGTAGGAGFTVSPESVLFADELVNTVSANQVVTLTNNSGATAALGVPTYPAGFKVQTTCGASLSNGASCRFYAAFAPTVAGPVSGAISLPITGQPTLTIGLAGTGTVAGLPAALVPNPPIVDYGQLVVGDNPAMTVTFTNATGLPVAIRGQSLTGATDFTITANTCSGTIAGGASCTIQFTVIPVVADGTETATFTLTEGSGAQTQVPLTAQVLANGGGSSSCCARIWPRSRRRDLGHPLTMKLEC